MPINRLLETEATSGDPVKISELASGQATWKWIFFQVVPSGPPRKIGPMRVMRIEAKALTAINRRCVGEP